MPPGHNETVGPKAPQGSLFENPEIRSPKGRLLRSSADRFPNWNLSGVRESRADRRPKGRLLRSSAKPSGSRGPPLRKASDWSTGSRLSISTGDSRRESNKKLRFENNLAGEGMFVLYDRKRKTKTVLKWTGDEDLRSSRDQTGCSSGSFISKKRQAIYIINKTDRQYDAS